MTLPISVANEMRKDYLINRWTVIATQRKKRPTDFKRVVEEKKQDEPCALDPGNEHMTPPAVLVYLSIDGGIRRDKDLNGFRHKNWLVRCVPNLYPAFTPPAGESWFDFKGGVFSNTTAVGHHEVLIESPNHDEHPSVARIPQLIHVINACADRLRELSSKPYVKYVSIFRNHGLEAGASLSHAHTQLIATPIMPYIVQEELKASGEWFEKNDACVFCEILGKEEESPRHIWRNEHFTVFAPWASVHPFEFWIFPNKHECCMLDMSESEVNALAKAMRICMGGLRSLLGDPPYNYGFHQVTAGACDSYHWHLEVYPRLSIWAGFEKSTGMFINIVSPEDAAASLREATAQEQKTVNAT